ncbi:GNAT family N-acetyltransferase [Pseudemcibacter aquimaris]|uniref:GNAT family N-acetyltransferase n=1 Tax=Pseudemcibacter aquimaris TaxID=2857064 RepID=UPI0020137267|nr:GNAT family N-acetyltransferase [Pseudemcibacter aquimaris]MCC3860965.1 N-acetyltransferase family protein [Pseudemcibacter aquimaris]WDU59783.1 GNAT family N-acetyltransferase [Pseudemcibacter aquimaris]
MNKTAPVVRPSTDDDIGAVQRIYEYEVLNGTATFDKVPPTVEDLVIKRQAIIDQGFPHFVAEINDLVVGYSYVSLYRQRSAYSQTVENAIYIDPDYRGQGVASALMKELLDKCQELNLKQVIAVIGDSENHGSIKLHSNLGFRKVGTMEKVGFKFDRWIDVVLMQKSL